MTFCIRHSRDGNPSVEAMKHDGTFLVRESETYIGEFALSFLVNGKVFVVFLFVCFTFFHVILCWGVG